MESEPRKPKSVKIQPKMVSQASEGDLMCLGSLPVPLIDSSCTKTRSRIPRMVHMHVINLVIIFITEIYYIKLNTVSANGNHDRRLILCTVGLGVKSGDKMIFGWIVDNLKAYLPCNNFVITFITNLLHRKLTQNVIFMDQID